MCQGSDHFSPPPRLLWSKSPHFTFLCRDPLMCSIAPLLLSLSTQQLARMRSVLCSEPSAGCTGPSVRHRKALCDPCGPRPGFPAPFQPLALPPASQSCSCPRVRASVILSAWSPLPPAHPVGHGLPSCGLCPSFTFSGTSLTILSKVVAILRFPSQLHFLLPITSKTFLCLGCFPTRKLHEGRILKKFCTSF